MWVCRLPVHIDPAVCTCFLQNCSANLQLPNGPTESSAPTTSLSSPCRGGRLCPPAEYVDFTEIFGEFATAQWADVGRRPLQQVSALPVGADDSVRPQNAVVFSEIYGEFATSSRADVGIGPYRARRRFAAAHRAGQSPAPTKAWANSYCFADFERRAFLHQSFKGNCYQSWCTVTGGAYLNARRTTLCVRNG